MILIRTHDSIFPKLFRLSVARKLGTQSVFPGRPRTGAGRSLVGEYNPFLLPLNIGGIQSRNAFEVSQNSDSSLVHAGLDDCRRLRRRDLENLHQVRFRDVMPKRETIGFAIRIAILKLQSVFINDLAAGHGRVQDNK
jgi:hypothetical protein